VKFATPFFKDSFLVILGSGFRHQSEDYNRKSTNSYDEKPGPFYPIDVSGNKKCYGEPNGHEAGYGGYGQGNTYGNSPFHDPTLKKIPSKSLAQHWILDSLRKAKFGYENLEFH